MPDINKSGEPSSFLQSINTLLHTPPISFLFNGIFWSCLLIFITPLVGISYFLYMLFQLGQYLLYSPLLFVENKNESNSSISKEKELAILITGCDSGFGLNASLELSKRGFIVFAGCYSPQNMQKFQGNEKIIAFEFDVTKKEHIDQAFEKVKDWLSSKYEDKKNISRVLHAILNNAGTVLFGPTDWLDLSVFRHVMEVNFFGAVQVTKTFLPILKSQSYQEARIINMVSIAGFICGNVGAPYPCSKHALQAFTTILRNELKPWNIQVISLNPSFHKTPLIDQTFDGFNKLWNNLSENLKKEYGQEYYNALIADINSSNAVLWDPKNVINSIVKAVDLKNPPVQMLIGMDCQYLFTLLSLLPVNVMNAITPPHSIAARK